MFWPQDEPVNTSPLAVPPPAPPPTHTVHESCGLCVQHFCRQRHYSTTVTLTSNSTDRQQVRTCVCVNVRVQTKWGVQCDDPSEWNRKNPNLAPLDQCIPTTSDRLKVATQFAGQCLTKVSRRAVKRYLIILAVCTYVRMYVCTYVSTCAHCDIYLFMFCWDCPTPFIYDNKTLTYVCTHAETITEWSDYKLFCN